MATTFSTPFIPKPDTGYRLADANSFWNAIVNSNAISRAYNITAAGTTQATAVQLTSVYNEVDTATANQGVNLPNSKGTTGIPFNTCIVWNNTTANILVYAAQGSTDTINGIAAATGILLPAGAVGSFFSAKPGVWCSDLGTGTVLTGFSANQMGTFTANGATPVTVANANVTANSQVLVTLKTVGGTVGTSAPNVRTITAGTGFTIAGVAGDTSVYNYAIVG